jgi:hypothetical protein
LARNNKDFEELMEDWWCDEEIKVNPRRMIDPFPGTQETIQNVEYYDLQIIW